MGQRSYSEDDGYGLVIKLLIFTALLWIAFEGFKIWQAKKDAEIQAQQSQVRRANSGSEVLNTAPPIPRSLPPSKPQAAVPSDGVYRCGNAYSNVPCPGAKAVNVAPPVSYSGNSARKEIYLCKDYSGNLTWENVPCSLNGRFMDRVASVPADIPWDQQVAIAHQQRSKAQAIAAEQVVPVMQASTGTGKPAECKYLDDYVNQLDAEGRAGGSSRKMDRIREARKNSRDRQFRIGC